MIDMKNTWKLGVALPNLDIRKYPPCFGGCGYYLVLKSEVFLTPSNLWVQGVAYPSPGEGVFDEKIIREVVQGIESINVVLPVMLFGVEDPREYYREQWRKIYERVSGDKHLHIIDRINGRQVLMGVVKENPLNAYDIGEGYVVEELINPFPVEEVWVILYDFDEKRGRIAQTSKYEFPYGVFDVSNPGVFTLLEELMEE